jgi:ABC-type branched-subunit amino acid transport system ATPase component
MLRIVDVTKYFGRVRALESVTVRVDRGELVGLIGPNGSGKTTLINVITGYYEPDGGTVYLGDRKLTGMKPHEIAALGVARTFQVPRVFRSMTVMQNLTAALAYNSEARKGAEERADWLLGALGLSEKRDELASNLSGGQQRLLEIARALIVNPKVLLLDEPTAGLNPAVIETLRELLQRVKESGTAVLMVEHNMRVVSSFCDRVVAMNEGVIVAEGRPEEVLLNEAVIEAYLGR